MAIQTKTELLASNNTAFPDNTEGLITPAILRGFNTASIDSYAALSGSNTFVGNQVITGSVVATSFTGSFSGNLAGTSSWADNATTSSHALFSISASYASASTSASLALTASTVSVASDNGNQNHKVVFTNSTGSNETLLYDPNDFEYNPNQNLLTVTASYANFAVSSSYALTSSYANTSTSASYASASTSASYALVAESANTIGNTTISGIQTYTYSQNGLYKSTHKFVTGSFNIVSGSWTKIMTITSTTSSWKGSGRIMGSTITSPGEFGIGGWGVVFRQGSTSLFGQQAGFITATFGSATNTLAIPEFSGSASGSNSIDIFARNAYNATSSLLIDCVFNYQTGSFTYTFF